MGRRPVDLEIIREALRIAVRRAGARPVARAVGMSPTGLTKALSADQCPLPQTELKMREWYLRQQRYLGPDPRTAHQALDLLLEGIPEHRQSLARRYMAEGAQRVYREVGAQPPAWVERILGPG